MRRLHMDILRIIDIFTEKDKKFNREMVQRAKHNTNEGNPAGSIRKKLPSASKYFGFVNDILNDYRKRWGTV